MSDAPPPLKVKKSKRAAAAAAAAAAIDGLVETEDLDAVLGGGAVSESATASTKKVSMKRGSKKAGDDAAPHHHHHHHADPLEGLTEIVGETAGGGGGGGGARSPSNSAVTASRATTRAAARPQGTDSINTSVTDAPTIIVGRGGSVTPPLGPLSASGSSPPPIAGGGGSAAAGGGVTRMSRAAARLAGVDPTTSATTRSTTSVKFSTVVPSSLGGGGGATGLDNSNINNSNNANVNILADLERAIFTHNFSAPSTVNGLTNRILHGTMLRLNFPDMAATDKRMAELEMSRLSAMSGVSGSGGGGNNNNPLFLSSPSASVLQTSSRLHADSDYLTKATALSAIITDASLKVKTLLRDEGIQYNKQENAARSAEVKQKSVLSVVRGKLEGTTDRIRSLEDRLATAAAATVGIEQHLAQTSARVKRGKSIGILLRYFSALDTVNPQSFATALDSVAKNREKQRIARTTEWKFHPHLVSHTNPLYFLTADPALAQLNASAAGIGRGGGGDEDGGGNGAGAKTTTTARSRRLVRGGGPAADDDDDDDDDLGGDKGSKSTFLRRRKAQMRMTPHSHEDPTVAALLGGDDDDDDERPSASAHSGSGGKKAMSRRKKKKFGVDDDDGEDPLEEKKMESDDDEDDSDKKKGGSSDDDDDDDDAASDVSDVRARKKVDKRKSKKGSDSDSDGGGGGAFGGGRNNDDGMDDESDEEAASNLNNHLTAAGAPIRLHPTENAAMKLGIPRVFACRYLAEDAVRRISQLKPFVASVTPVSMLQQQQQSTAADKKGGGKKGGAAVSPGAASIANFYLQKKNPIEDNNPNAFANITLYAAWLEGELVKEALHLVKTYGEQYREGGVGGGGSGGGGSAGAVASAVAAGGDAAAAAAGKPGGKRTLKRGGASKRGASAGGTASSSSVATVSTATGTRTTIKLPNATTAANNNTRLHKTILKAIEEISTLYATLTGTTQGLLDAFLKSSLADIRKALNERLRLTPLPPPPPLPKESSFWAMDIFQKFNKHEMTDFTQFLVGRTKRELAVVEGFGASDASSTTTRKTLLSQIINNGLRPFLEMTMKDAGKYAEDLVAQKARLSPRSEQKSRRRVNDAIAYSLSMYTELFLKGKEYGKHVAVLMSASGGGASSSSSGADQQGSQGFGSKSLNGNLLGGGADGGSGGAGAVMGYEEGLVQSTIETIFATTRKNYITQGHERVLLTSYFSETDSEYRVPLAVNADEFYDFRPEAHTPKAREILTRAKECMRRVLTLAPSESIEATIGELASVTIREIGKFLKKELEKTKESCQKDVKRWYEGDSSSKIKTREQAYEKYIKNADAQSHVCALRMLVWAQTTLIELFDMLSSITSTLIAEYPNIINFITTERITHLAPVDAISEDILNLVMNAIITRTLTIFNKLQTARDYYNPSAKGRNATMNRELKGGAANNNDSLIDPTLLQLNGNSLACDTACRYLSIQLSQCLSFIRLSSLPIPREEGDEDIDAAAAAYTADSNPMGGGRGGGGGSVYGASQLMSPLRAGASAALEDDSGLMSPSMRPGGGGFGGGGGGGNTNNVVSSQGAVVGAIGEFDFWATVANGSSKASGNKAAAASSAAAGASSALANYIARRAAFQANGGAGSNLLSSAGGATAGFSLNAGSAGGSGAGSASSSSTASSQPLFPTPQHLPSFIKGLRMREMLNPQVPTFARVLGVSLYKGITAHLRSFMLDDVGAITYQQDVNLIRSTIEPLVLCGRLDGIVVGVLFDIIRETAKGFMVLVDQIVGVYKSGYLGLLEYDEKLQYWRMRADMKELFKSTGIGS